MQQPFRLFGLLHIAASESSAENVKVSNFGQQLAIYLANAITLSRSLAARGVEFVLLTNDKNRVDSMLHARGQAGSVATETLPCATSVPSGVRFYSAHFKLDVFRYLSVQPAESYAGFVDLDIIAANAVPPCLDRIITRRIPLCYDISDQVIPAYGHARILADMRRLSTDVHEGRWSGGEFLCGPPDFFAAVLAEAEKIFERYLDCHTELHHQGDEIITSVALEKLRIERRYYIADAGKLGVIGRYWSSPVRHPQPSFHYFRDCFLLHLPADKRWLAACAGLPPGAREELLERYDYRLKLLGLRAPLHTLRRLWA